MSLLRLRPAELSDPPFPLKKSGATADEVFIADGWHKSWQNSEWAGTGQRHRAFAEVHATIQALAARGMQISVLDSPSIGTFVGFVAHETRQDGRAVLHYVYVKDALRRRGFGTRLMGSIDTTRYLFTHKTRFSRYLPRGTHRSELARRKNL